MRYEVKMKYEFDAKVLVEASSREEAERKASEGFGCCNPTYHSNDYSIIDWNADTHPSSESICLRECVADIKCTILDKMICCSDCDRHKGCKSRCTSTLCVHRSN